MQNNWGHKINGDTNYISYFCGDSARGNHNVNIYLAPGKNRP